MKFNLSCLFFFILFFSTVSEALASESITLGIFAYRPKPVMIERYQPLVDYLNAKLKDTRVILQVLEQSEMKTALDNNALDLLFTNPRHYIILRSQNELTGTIATLVKRSFNGQATQQLGGVIFTRSDFDGIENIADLEGRSVAAPGMQYLGGYQCQAYELLQAGLDPIQDINLLQVGRHDEVVKMVLSGQADAGFIRTEILEDLSIHGELDLTRLKVINRQIHQNFPFISSTELYPEWPFVALSHLDRRLVSRIASVLMALDESHPAALAASIIGFAPPSDYLAVENVARELRLPPFDSVPEVTLSDFWVKNKVFIIFALLSLMIIAFLFWLLAYRNYQLKENSESLLDAIASQDAILSAIPELMFELDLEGRYLNVWARNPGELTATRSTMLGKTVSEVMPEESAAIVLDALKQAKIAGQSHGQQIYLTTQEGGMWFELSTSIKSWQGDLPRFIMLSRDITFQKESERQLATSQDRYRGLFENMSDGVAIYKAVDDGADFEFIDFNQAGERIDQIKREDLIGKKVLDVFPGIKAMGLFDVLQRVWRSGQSETFPMNQYSDNGLTGWRENFVYRLDSGEIIATYSDETARKLAEQKLRDSESQKQLIFQTVPDLMWLKDVDGGYMACNQLFENFIGYTEAEIIGKTDYQIDRADADFYHTHDQAAIHADRALINEQWVTFKGSGKKALLETTKIPFKSDQNEVLGVLGIGHDITRRYYAEEAQRLAASVFEHSQEGIIITDEENNIIDANPACFRLTGYSPDELKGNNPSLLSSGTHPPDFYDDMWNLLNTKGHWQGEVINRKKMGEIFTERLSIDVVKNDSGKFQHYVAVFSDISYLKEQELELERVAYSDALTSLPNRLLLHDRMQQAINQASRHKKMVAVCYLDLDGFKPINDEYGHNAGDEVLVEVACRLQRSLRDEDSVARLGGDEFVLLLLNLHSVFELEQLIDRILHTVSEPYTLTSEKVVSVSASIGIALYPLDESEPDTLLRHADQAMYTAKKRGKNQFSFFDPGEEFRAIATQKVHAEIEQAFINEEFVLLYQPKVNMRTGDIVGVEALVRWNHPVKGLLSPIEFLPVIEHSALIVELGKRVLQQTMVQMRLWMAAGIDINVSVNIAALQLQQPDFVESLKQLLAEFSDIAPSRLELEILETAALHDINHVSKIMNLCAELGVQFALDDFGTGYSSLTYLKQLPAQVLKIDQSFIRNLLEDPDDIAITEGVLGLTRAFRRTAIAEGVETVQHGSMLLSMGCELAQGYGIARPMSAEDLPEWMIKFKQNEEWKRIRQSNAIDVNTSLLMMAVEHHRLVSQIILAIKNDTPSLLPKNIKDAKNCKFGVWLEGEGALLYANHSDYNQLVMNHQEVHDLSQLAAEHLITGNTKKVLSIAKKLEVLRNSVLDSLNKLRH